MVVKTSVLDFVSFQALVLYGFYLDMHTFIDFMTGFEGDVAKVGKSMFFSHSWGYHFEVNLSELFESSDSEIFHEISVQEVL